MQSIFFRLFFLSFPLVFPQPAHGTNSTNSYGALAAEHVVPTLASLERELSALPPEPLPHQVKTARKWAGLLKEQLDLFAFAYPPSRADPWKTGRRLLDSGYGVLGKYKDLYDIQNVSRPEDAVYDAKELRRLWKPVRDWLHNWRDYISKQRAELEHPDLSRIHPRPRAGLSRLYWGAVSLRPKDELTGIANLAALCGELRAIAIASWPGLTRVANPADGEEQERLFHDFRKRIRSLVRITKKFPALYSGEAAPLAELDALSSAYGDLHDRIVAMEKAEERGQPELARRLHVEIGARWKLLLAEQERRGIPALLASLRFISD